MTDSMIERATKALYEHMCPTPPWRPWNELDLPWEAEGHRRMVRVVLAAMREPTTDMKFDGGTTLLKQADERCAMAIERFATEIWQAMIDAAVKEKP